jgi:hypothetical protein
MLADVTRPAAIVSDSAGVRLVLNPLSQWETGDEWQVALRPDFVTGDNEVDAVFDYIADVVVLANGDVLVVDTNAGQVTLLGHDGEFKKILGGKGQGPGEYVAPNAAERTRGDSVIVEDQRNNRLNILSPNGEFARSISVDGRGQFGLTPVGMLSDGRVLFWPLLYSSGRSQVEGSVWLEVDVFAMDLTLGIPEPILRLPAHLEERQGGKLVTHAFPQYALLGGGPNALWWARNSQAELRQFDHSGSLRSIVRWEHP